MKWMVAEMKLDALARGKFRSLSFDRTTFPDGRVETDCSIYVDPRISVFAPTWEEAFKKLRIEMGIAEPDVEESPEV